MVFEKRFEKIGKKYFAGGLYKNRNASRQNLIFQGDETFWLAEYPGVVGAIFASDKPYIKTQHLIIGKERCNEFYHGRLDETYVHVFESGDFEFLKIWKRLRCLRPHENVLQCLDYLVSDNKW